MVNASAALKRILFVDDEPALLDALRRMLRPLRGEWDVQVESSPKAALERLDLEHFDVVVADMRMPSIDGVSVLTHVMQRHPEVIRIVLSGQTELESAMRAVPVAHQFLSKPCDAERLKETINRISKMRDRLADPKMRALLGEVDGLPTLPTVCRELNQTLAREDFSIRDVSDIVEKDPALCAKILQLVNSSFFGVGRRLTYVHDAVSYLGTTMLKNLVTTVTLWREIEAARPGALAQISELHRHSQRIAVLARKMFGKDRYRAEEAFAAGLLHDLGMTLMVAYLPDRFSEIDALAKREGIGFVAAERRLFDVGHAEMGAYLLDAWGIPFSVLEAVSWHHDAPGLGHTRLESVDAVYIAQELVEPSVVGGPPGAALAPEYLAKLGVQNDLPTWVAWLTEA
jgi:HD-like signal output (HDOD) protein